MIIDLEYHLIVNRGADQLRALGGAKKDRSALNDVVHWEDLRSTIDARNEPP
jgi:hypothetical protein